MEGVRDWVGVREGVGVGVTVGEGVDVGVMVMVGVRVEVRSVVRAGLEEGTVVEGAVGEWLCLERGWLQLAIRSVRAMKK